jgi:hypothetical protein
MTSGAIKRFQRINKNDQKKGSWRGVKNDTSVEKENKKVNMRRYKH